MVKARSFVLAALGAALACSVFPDQLGAGGAGGNSGQGANAGVTGGTFPGTGGASDADGCGDTESDPDNCSACGTVCPGQNVALRRCVSGKCKPRCTPGFYDCTKPQQAEVDGCETPASVAACGDCLIQCDTGQACETTTNPNGQCVCDGVSCGPTGINCAGTPPLCKCPSDAGTLTCRPGEHCNDGHCECVTGQICTDLQICCPGGGCVNFLKDTQNCGGCGVHCEQGMACNGGDCKCTTASNCTGDGNTLSIACNSGKCSCNNVQCAAGQTCRNDHCD